MLYKYIGLVNPYTGGYLTKGLEGLPHFASIFLFHSNETSLDP